MQLVFLLNVMSKFVFRVQRYNKFLEYARENGNICQKRSKMIQKTTVSRKQSFERSEIRIAASRDHEMAMRMETRAQKRVHRTPCWMASNTMNDVCAG